ncbi:hypothetical protein LIER_36757 [Lithospermum erythrorhizon]|uniref:Reverse transcriptase domain-containing protein n=1 Tax=Lithospermum erythrorhizon TaxID=34254 RepID=A0AAV3PAX7_LITER
MVKKKEARNRISYIIKRDGSKISSCNEVANEMVEFYKGLFGTAIPTFPIDTEMLKVGGVLNADERSALVVPITTNEVKEAIFDIGDDKVPGPDGYSSALFKKNWKIVGEDFVKGVKEFFSCGKFLKQLNHTIVSHIPKTDHDPKVGDFRPIGCTNVAYKTITKILTKRMEPLLPKLVNSTQGAFLGGGGRLLSDDVFLVQELVRGYTTKRSTPRFMIKVDIRKAYDTVSWSFLEAMLVGLGFPEVYVGWIMEYVSMASYSISINGWLHGCFKGQRGLQKVTLCLPRCSLFAWSTSLECSR